MQTDIIFQMQPKVFRTMQTYAHAQKGHITEDTAQWEDDSSFFLYIYNRETGDVRYQRVDYS